MNDSKKHKKPQQSMVDETYGKLTTKKWNNPIKEMRHPEIAHTAVQRKTENRLYDTEKKYKDIRQSCQGIMSRILRTNEMRLKYIGHQNLTDFPNLLLTERKIVN